MHLQLEDRLDGGNARIVRETFEGFLCQFAREAGLIIELMPESVLVSGETFPDRRPTRRGWLRAMSVAIALRSNPSALSRGRSG